MRRVECNLEAQGFPQGSCTGERVGGELRACKTTLRKHKGIPQRLIHAVHLSRPENYLSIYQSGCNMACKKCHSWGFSQRANGDWMTPEEIARQAVVYESKVTLWEPRHKATAWHAHDTCRCCGSCVLTGKRSSACPGTLSRESVVLGPQGFGPARNIVAFTGGDLTCRPEFYGLCTRLIKSRTRLWVLVETNGYGLTPRNLDHLRESGVDGFWLDIKAYDAEKHRWLTGCSNDRILKLPGEIIERGFVLEVLSLYIPDVVEADQLGKIAASLMEVDPAIPFTILAFFPEYQIRQFRSPSVTEMVDAYRQVKQKGLVNVRLGNLGVFARTDEDWNVLTAQVDRDAY